MYPQSIPAISYTKSPKRRTSEELFQDYRCFQQSDIIDTSVDFNAKVQLQHRKESFSNPLETNDVFSRTNPLTKSTWSSSSIGKTSSQSAFTKVISPQRVPAFLPHHTQGQNHAARNLSMFGTPHSNQRKSTSTKTLKDFEAYEQSPCSSIPVKDMVFETMNSHKHSPDQNSPKPQSKIPYSTITCNVPTYNNTLLSDIPEEGSMNQTLASTSGFQQVVVSTTGQLPPTSQTVLFTIPQNFNVQQLSNQPLNLDMSSQQLLQSIVQISNQPEKNTTLDKDGNKSL